MKVSETWLKTLLHLPHSMKEIASQLTHAGLEVDSIDYVSINSDETLDATINSDKAQNTHLEAQNTNLEAQNTILTLKVPANRGDCLSMIGVAREVAVLNGLNYKPAEITASCPTITETVPIHIEAREACPRYLGRIVQNVQANQPTPSWIVSRLHDAGIRSVSVIVDITNYVMLELGQPLHAFDLEKLDTEIQVRFAKAGEQILTLDSEMVDLKKDTLVIADKHKPVAIAGLIGGKDSSVSEMTRSIFLESAYFDPIKIRSTSKGYNIRTESSHRFERGIDPQIQLQAIERATQLILEAVGGNPGPVRDCVQTDCLPKNTAIMLRTKKIKDVLGLCPENTKDILESLGMIVEPRGSRHAEHLAYSEYKVTPPSFRNDIALEVDLIEEIARIYGYEKIPKENPSVPFEFIALPEAHLSELHFKSTLVNRGYYEAITYSFHSQYLDELLTTGSSTTTTPAATTTPSATAASSATTASLMISNPISEDLKVMRKSLWPGLLKAVQHNQRRQLPRVRLFESGICFKVNDKGQVEQTDFFAGVITGARFSEQWGEKTQPVDFFDIKSDVEALLNLNRQTDISFRVSKQPLPSLHPGQSCEILLGEERVGRQAEQPIGQLGALHPALIKALDLEGPVFLFELNMNAINSKKMPYFQELSKYPSVRRDIAFLVDQTLLAEELKSAIVNSAGNNLREIIVFDVYQGKGIPEGKKSVALGLILQHPTRTLTESEVNDSVSNVIQTVTEKFTATLRE